MTINALAQDDNGNIIDPYGGQNDLHHRLLRHVSPAFAEDPLRVLRVARFAARFGFTVDAMADLALPGPVERHRFLGLELKPGALAGARGVVRPMGRPADVATANDLALAS